MCLQVMEVFPSHQGNQPSYKHTLIFNKENLNLLLQESSSRETLIHELNPSDVLPNPELSYSFTGDNVPIVDPGHLSNVVAEQLCLRGKILGEALPLKLITSKSLSERKPSEDVSIVNIGNSFSLIKFSSVMDKTKFFKANCGLWDPNLWS